LCDFNILKCIHIDYVLEHHGIDVIIILHRFYDINVIVYRLLERKRAGKHCSEMCIYLLTHLYWPCFLCKNKCLLLKYEYVGGGDNTVTGNRALQRLLYTIEVYIFVEAITVKVL